MKAQAPAEKTPQTKAPGQVAAEDAITDAIIHAEGLGDLLAGLERSEHIPGPGAYVVLESEARNIAGFLHKALESLGKNA